MKFLIGLLLLCQCAAFSLNATAATYEYKKHWQDSGWMKSDAKSAFKLMQKRNLVVAGAVSASVTVTKNNKENITTILNLLKNSAQLPEFVKENIDGLNLYEALDKKTGIVYRVVHNVKTNEFSMASVQVRFLLPTYVETHLWQVELLNRTQASGKASAFFKLLAPAAYAENLVTGAQSYVRDIGGRMDASLADTVKNPLNSISNSMDKVGSSLDRALTTKNVAKLAAVSGVVFGVSSTLASMSTHFLVQGGYDTLRNLFYEAKGELKPEEKEKRLKRFNESMQSFKALTPVINELESKVTLMALLMTYASNTNGENLLAKLNQDIEAKKKAQTEGVAACTECDEQARLLTIPQLEALKQIMQETGLSKKELADQGCQLLDDMYSSWKVAETNIFLVRRNVMQDMSLFNSSIMESIQDDKSFQEKRKQTNACEKIPDQKLAEIARKISGADCDRDFSNLLCREREAYLSAKKSCSVSAAIQHTESDQTRLTESAAATTRIMARFSTRLENMTCDSSKAGCEKGSLDKTRDFFTANFTTAAAACKNSFIAEELAQRPVKAPVASSTTSAALTPSTSKTFPCGSLLNCISSFLAPIKPSADRDSANRVFELYSN